MKVLVCGSRHFNDERRIEEALLGMGEVTEVIEGGARGADKTARSVSERLGIRVSEFPADWEKHGKAAGPIRNIQMLKEGKPDKVLAFLAPDSRGTKHMIEIAQKAGVETKIVRI